ncbi:MAG: hypothetical protein FWH14_01845 [Oscillospiraceae bacterium]|nr:hypothetical protein [Oscillospiraceae bacterium]
MKKYEKPAVEVIGFEFDNMCSNASAIGIDPDANAGDPFGEGDGDGIDG